MKYIWLGIKDYCKDCWHDFWFKFWNALWTFTQRRTCKCYVWRNSEGLLVKGGNLWHYIQQRKAAKLLKEIKTLQKELKQQDVK